MLTDLLRGAAPAREPAGSTGLSGLIAGAAARPMSLPQAMNALARGELERPLDGEIGAVVSDLPARPAPQPRPLSYQAEIDAAQIDARVDRDEMRSRIQRQRDELQASAAYTNDPTLNQRAARERYQKMKRLDELAAQLGEDHA